MTKNRTLASLISNDTSKIKTVYTDSDSVVTSASLGVTAAAGTATYSSADTLPVSATNGDQALVTSTNRLYIYTNGGWYNIALVNTTPYFTTSAAATYDLSTTGAATTITLLAVDSEGINIVYTATTDSDFDGIATLSRDSDNGRIFTITPTDSENGTAVTGTGTITFKASDGVNVASTLSTFNLTFITTISNSNYTTLLSKADTAGTDNQVDASTNTYTITEAGNVTSSAFSPYHPGGYSTYFDGTGDYLSGNDMGLGGAGTFTVEAWVYPTVYNTYANDIYSHGANSSVGADFLAFGLKPDGNVQMFKGSGTPALLSTSAPCATLNQWYHVAFVRESNNNTSAYVNGVLVAGPTTLTGALTSAPSGRAFIGTQSYSAGASDRSFEGYMRDVRIINGTAVYTSAFTSPTEPLTAIANTSLLTCHAPYIADGSSNNHAITTNGNTSTKRFGPYDYIGYAKADHNGSLYCDGTGDGIEIASAAATQFGTGEWTIEGWFYPYDQAATQVLLYGYENAYSSTPGTYELYIGTSGAQTTPQINGNNGSWATSATSIASTETFQYETWNHIVWSRSGNNLRIFVNGKSGANHAISASQTYDMKRGESQFFDKDGASGFRGYVSDLRIVKGTAVYTADFTPPTAPLTAITNTQLLTCTNKNDIWEQADGKPFTKVTGGPTVTNAQRKFTTSSALYFAGTSNTYLLKDLGETIGTRDFTVEAWVYPTTTGAQHVFQISNQTVGYQSITTQNTQVGIGMNNGFWRYGTTGWNFGYVHTTTAVVVNTWHHVAYVRTGGYSKLYLNGTEIHSNADTSNYSARYLAYGVGHQSNNVWYGYTQGLRVALGYARYTSNFTPPTEELDG